MTAVDTENSLAVQNVMLSVIGTGIAGFILHFNHLKNIIEFITLKVNRVIYTMI